jgi:hypothetical protein
MSPQTLPFAGDRTHFRTKSLAAGFWAQRFSGPAGQKQLPGKAAQADPSGTPDRPARRPLMTKKSNPYVPK